MIKVTVTNTTQAKELIEAFNGKYYNVEIVIKENTVGQDDVLSKLAKPLIEHIRKHGNPHQTIIITDHNVKLVEDIVGIPLQIKD